MTNQLTPDQDQMMPSLVDLAEGIVHIVCLPISITRWIAGPHKTLVCALFHPIRWKHRREWNEGPRPNRPGHHDYVWAYCKCGREWIDDHFDSPF